jgi:hypothetical protein
MADKSKDTRTLFIIFVELRREAPAEESSPGREVRKVLRQRDVLNLYLDKCDHAAVNRKRDREAVNCRRDREAVNETWRAAAGDSGGWKQWPHAIDFLSFG